MYYKEAVPAEVEASTRTTRRDQTHQRIFGAAIAESKRLGIGATDVASIVAAGGVAHGTFYLHFPAKEHVLLELEAREEARLAGGYGLLTTTDNVCSRDTMLAGLVATALSGLGAR